MNRKITEEIFEISFKQTPKLLPLFLQLQKGMVIRMKKPKLVVYESYSGKQC